MSNKERDVVYSKRAEAVLDLAELLSESMSNGDGPVHVQLEDIELAVRVVKDRQALKDDYFKGLEERKKHEN